MILSIVQTTGLSLRLCGDQRQVLRSLLSTEAGLNHEPTPDAVKGFDGIMKAHNILLDRNAMGVLIGGLSSKIWNRNRTFSQLEGHKDVDVLVLPKGDDTNHFKIEEKFEGGIDWWLPKKDRIEAEDQMGIKISVNQIWFQNGYDCKLRFGFRLNGAYREGLHVLLPESVADMRFKEAVASVNVEVDTEVEDSFYSKVTRSMGTCVPRFIRDSGLTILKDDDVYVEEFDRSIVRVIDRHK